MVLRFESKDVYFTYALGEYKDLKENYTIRNYIQSIIISGMLNHAKYLELRKHDDPKSYYEVADNLMIIFYDRNTVYINYYEEVIDIGITSSYKDTVFMLSYSKFLYKFFNYLFKKMNHGVLYKLPIVSTKDIFFQGQGE